MFDYNVFGYVVVLGFGFVLFAGPVARKFPKQLRQLLLLGFIVHAGGSIVRYAVLYGYYDGGDAGSYYRSGLKYAEMIWSLDFSLFDHIHRELPRWWGTQMTMWISGFFLALIGPTRLGGFLFFGILAYVALALFAKAFQRSYGESNLRGYLVFLLFWPSLWFWPSSIGKDALILLATGLVVFGFTGKRIRILWMPLLLGLSVAAVIRPQVAGIMIVSIGIAHWISPGKQWGAIHYLQGIVILIVLALVMRHSLSSVGIDQFDLDEFKGYLETTTQHSEQGGSAISAPIMSATGIPLAIINILFRPFPWEASNPMSATASAEMLLFWYVVWRRRARIASLARQWRATRLLRVSVPLSILYIIALGLAVSNLGIIARQRIHVMPLLFIWLEAQPVLAQTVVKRVLPWSHRTQPRVGLKKFVTRQV